MKQSPLDQAVWQHEADQVVARAKQLDPQQTTDESLKTYYQQLNTVIDGHVKPAHDEYERSQQRAQFKQSQHDQTILDQMVDKQALNLSSAKTQSLFGNGLDDLNQEQLKQ